MKDPIYPEGENLMSDGVGNGPAGERRARRGET